MTGEIGYKGSFLFVISWVLYVVFIINKSGDKLLYVCVIRSLCESFNLWCLRKTKPKSCSILSYWKHLVTQEENKEQINSVNLSH